MKYRTVKVEGRIKDIVKAFKIIYTLLEDKAPTVEENLSKMNYKEENRTI